jgi:SnoaL-like protein
VLAADDTSSRDPSTALDDAAAIVEKFAAVWAVPEPERFLPLFTQDVRLVAPLVETSIGLDRAYEEFARLLYVWPAANGIVHRWSATDDLVYIEWTLRGEFRGRSLEFLVVDRLVLRAGLIAEREMFADGLRIAPAFLRSPTAWARIWRSGIGPGPTIRRLMRATTSRRRFRRPQAAVSGSTASQREGSGR